MAPDRTPDPDRVPRDELVDDAASSVPGAAPGVGLDPRREPPYDPDAVLAALPDLGRRLGARERDRVDLGGFRRAAVLVPILDGAAGPELLFTVRAAHLPHHAGQIAFPGGGLEGDETLEAAALRETLEEIGVRVEPAALLGRLDDHPSPARYVATPVVARLSAPERYRIDRREVGEVFTAPLAELATVAAASELRVQPRFRRRIHSFEWRERRIWGFTGNVLKNLLDVLAGRAAEWER